MSFAVVHMQKFKINGIKGIQFHNQRERESKTNPDIDKSKTHLNYDLHNPTKIDFNKAIKEKIKNNVITNRAIRKDAVVMCNFVITSDKKFFNGLTDQQQKKFFEKSYEFFKNRYGEKNIVSANIHLDEKTPHMHLSLVPVTKDNKLSAKRLFDRNELRSIQDNYPKFMRGYGFDLERGIDAEGKNKHIEIQKLKAIEIENKVKVLEQQQSIVKNDLKALESEKKDVESIRVAFEDINAVEVKYGAFNKGLINNIKGFENIKLLAKKTLLLESELGWKNKYIKDLEGDMEKLKEYLNKPFDKNRNLENKIYDLEMKLGEYRKEYGYLVDYLNDTNQIDKVKDYVEDKRQIEKQNFKKISFEFER
jgi:hypothetical protein